MSPSEQPDEPEPAPRRRVRYRGTHPRRFGQKYKERDEQRYPESVAKVIASGKTPAGSHRPICLSEILDVLTPAPGEIGVDATLGHAGHALELVARVLPGGRLIGLDTDPLELPRAEARLRAAGYDGSAFVAVHANYAAIASVVAAQGVPAVEFVLADLGCSSMQLDNPEREFSYKHDGPLDLRMNPTRGAPASEFIAMLSTEQIETLLREVSDETHAPAIARAIVRARTARPIRTTAQLAAVVSASVPRSEDGTGALARTFQALRIAVNDELGALDALLRALPWCLAAGGRVAILSFHSGEDRRVKHAFQAGLRDGIYSEIANEVIRPSKVEVSANSRAASAKLRWARRAAEGKAVS